jgi:hypothetical protein
MWIAGTLRDLRHGRPITGRYLGRSIAGTFLARLSSDS